MPWGQLFGEVERGVKNSSHLAGGRPEVQLGADMEDLTPVPDELPPPELVGDGVQDPGVEHPEDE